MVVGSSGQVERLSCAATRSSYGGAVEVAVVERGEPVAHRGDAHAGRAGAVGDGSGCLVDGRPAIASRPSARPRARVATCATFWSAKASQLTRRASSPVSSSTSCGTCSSEVEVDTATVAGERAQRLGALRSAGEVVAPDVVAVDDAGDEGLAASDPRSRVELRGQRAAHEVEADGLDRGRGERRQRVVERAVRRGDEDRRAWALRRAERV